MKKERSKGIGYYVLYGISYLHALLPLSVLYILSDILFPFLYYIVRYRRKLVRKNLNNSFPNYSQDKIIQIEKDFYHFLCDYYVETIKLLYISEAELKRRMVFENIELLNNVAREGKSCLLSLGHYCNWEYVPLISYCLDSDIYTGQIYKKLSNKDFDDFFYKIRNQFKSQNIEMRDAFRSIIKNKQEGKIMVIGFITDQRPKRYNDEYWTQFLNQNTLTLTGMERIARQFSYPVVYLDIQRVKRGHYKGVFKIITTDASIEKEYVVTEKYMRYLEGSILRDPAYWLWSHNRWKFKKKD